MPEGLSPLSKHFNHASSLQNPYVSYYCNTYLCGTLTLPCPVNWRFFEDTCAAEHLAQAARAKIQATCQSEEALCSTLRICRILAVLVPTSPLDITPNALSVLRKVFTDLAIHILYVYRRMTLTGNYRELMRAGFMADDCLFALMWTDGRWVQASSRAWRGRLDYDVWNRTQPFPTN